MALVISRPTNPKSQLSLPLRRTTHRPGSNAVPLRPVSQLPFFPKFGIRELKPEKVAKSTKLLTHFHGRICNGTVKAMANAAFEEAAAEQERVVGGRRILLSDVVVERPRRIFWRRKWSSMDLGTAGVVLAMHLLGLFAPFQFNWGAFWVAVALYVVTGLFGITLSFHRNLSHRSFKLPKWLEYLFAYCGVLALQVCVCQTCVLIEFLLFFC